MPGKERIGNATERLQIMYRNNRGNRRSSCSYPIRLRDVTPKRTIIEGTPIPSDPIKREKSHRVTEATRRQLAP